MTSASSQPPFMAWHEGRVASVVRDAVATGQIVGAVVLVSRQGEICNSIVAGAADREAGIPMQAGYCFRIASMTKAIVSAAALAMMDRQLLSLDDNVRRWLPDFAPALADGRQPQITLRHLLTHTSGLGYTFTEPTDSPFNRLAISDGLDDSPVSLMENVSRIARTRLLFEPGSAWSYSIATDVLGAVLEAAARRPLQQIVADFITVPLDMQHTSFHVNADAMLTVPYAPMPSGVTRMGAQCTLPLGDAAIRYAPGRAFRAGAWPSAGTGLLSTAADYMKFLEAVRTGGAPILEAESCRQFTTNAIGALATAFGPGFGWSLGLSVLTDPAAAKVPGNAGAWNWGGVYGSHFLVDPMAELCVVCLTNTALVGMNSEFTSALRLAVYDDAG